MKDQHIKILQTAIRDLETFYIYSGKGKLYRLIIDDIEKTLIKDILCKTEGNKLKAAKILGINRNTLHSKIKKLGIAYK